MMDILIFIAIVCVCVLILLCGWSMSGMKKRNPYLTNPPLGLINEHYVTLPTKPILIVRVDIENEQIANIKDTILKATNNEYHVLMVKEAGKYSLEFEIVVPKH